jgi:type IV pilus assembly protein PilA
MSSTQGDIIVTSKNDPGLSAAASKTMILRGIGSTATGTVAWTCGTDGTANAIPKKYLPSSCKDF